MSDTKCLTFYSYKGGSGRSVTCVNTTLHLIAKADASPQHPILLVDADLESAGLTYFFHCENKFTDSFQESIHTTKILSFVEDTLEGMNGRIIFGDSADLEAPLAQNLLGKLKALFQDDISPELMDELFFDFQLPRTALNMFRKIVECYEQQERMGPDAMKEEQPRNAGIVLAYDLRKLMDDLMEIHCAEAASDRRLEQKRNLFISFLPAAKFVDVSEYFGVASGTVQFLGADVRYQDEQILRNGTEEAIDLLLDMCTEHGYRAVIFDSGAGVQSTAHVLHSVSDVMVYCMRPTQQFIEGTKMQLSRYSLVLSTSQGRKNEKDPTKKAVILLPTAVPSYAENQKLCEDSFRKIQNIASLCAEFIDASFCTQSAALNEVGLFKWREVILGTAPLYFHSAKDPTLYKAIEQYARVNTMPADAKSAFEVYRRLAQRLWMNA